MRGDRFHGPGSRAAKTSTATKGVPGKLPRQFETAGGRRGSPAARRKKQFKRESRRQARGLRFGPQGCSGLHLKEHLLGPVPHADYVWR
jgi:hypothetical protein